MKDLRLILVLSLFLALSTAAGPPPRTTGDVALRGLDPVALCEGEEIPGLEDLTARFGRHEYRFASESSQERFLAEPERWAIQWGGGCARMGPLSGQGSPERWTVYDGRIYVFASDSCRDFFLKGPERFIEAAREFPVADLDRQRQGRAWIDKAVAAHGGAAAIDAKKRLLLGRQQIQQEWTWSRELELTSAGHVRRTSTWTPPASDESAQATETVWVLNDEEATANEDGARFELVSAEERGDLLRYAHRQPLALLWLRDTPSFDAVYFGEDMLGDTPAVDVLVRAKGLVTWLHLSPEDGRVLGLSWRGRLREGVTREVTEVFTDWRTIDGVLVPVERTCSIDGKVKKTASGAWETVELSD